MTNTKRFQRVNKNRLRHLRMEKGWSQEELAKRSGYSERLIRKAESGGTVSTQTIRDLAEALSDEERRVTYQELVMDPLSLAKQFVHAYDHFGQRMLDHCREIFHESFVFYCPGDKEQAPFAGEWVGITGMQRFFDRFYTTFSRNLGTLNPTFLVAEDHVCARYFDQVFFQGHTLPQIWVNLHFRFQDGLIIRIDDEYDTKAAASDFADLLARLATTNPNMQSTRSSGK